MIQYNVDQIPESGLVDKILEILTLIFMAAVWLLAVYYYPRLSTEIPLHFDFHGNADEYGARIYIFFLPFFLTLIYFTLTHLSRHPERFSYPFQNEKFSKEICYKMAVRLLRILKLNVSVVFLIIIISVISTVLMKTKGPGNWILPVIFSLIFIPIIFYLIKMRRMK